MKKYPYYHVNKYFNTNQINKINEIVEKNYHGYEKEGNGDYDLNGKSKKSSVVKLIKHSFLKKELSSLIDTFLITNIEEYGYSLYPLTNNDVFLYNTYQSETNSSYDWHKDISNNFVNDIKLTILINLSNNYDGGEFWINNGNPIMIEEFNNPGTAIIFKSDILHTVKPVTSGTRKTLTIFLYGPNWK